MIRNSIAPYKKAKINYDNAMIKLVGENKYVRDDHKAAELFLKQEI